MHDTASERILERNPVEEMMKAFSLFDQDRAGKITLKNLRKIAAYAIQLSHVSDPTKTSVFAY